MVPSGTSETALGVSAFLATLVICELLRRFALKRSLLDRPNDRSLHQLPTPRLGGVAIVLSVLASAAALARSHDLAVLFLVAAVVATLGLLDDLRPLSASVRFPLQIAVGAAFVHFAVGETSQFVIAPDVSLRLPHALVFALLVIWIVGVLNIYNFMDGMDGLAGAQSVSASTALAVVFAAVGPPELASFAVVLASASGGFLVHNISPARIFMGDAGSTFIGLSLAGLAAIEMNHGVPLAVGALSISPFLLDGTFTLFRRALRRERVWRAHRTHLYQRAVQAGLGHREVLLVYIGWMAAAIALTSFARSSAFACAGAWLVSVALLVAVWRWVVWLESKQPVAT